MVLRENHSIQGQGPPAVSQEEGDLQQLISQTTALLSSLGTAKNQLATIFAVDSADLRTILLCTKLIYMTNLY